MNAAVWGDFEVHFDRELGRGGMGIVYEALQISLNRIVAVKVMDASRAESPEALEEFLRRIHGEALALGRLQDSRIVAVYQAGRTDGRGWIAMERIQGKTVEQLLSGGRLSDGEAARIAKEVARALEAAQRAEILHRDVKPGNIFVCDDGSVKLADFGLAKPAELGRAKVTDSQSVTCTPAYVAPEFARGDEIDFRSDLYSLGCVIYEMVTERPPFQSGSPLDLLYKHCNEPIEPPRRLNPALSKALEAVILKCLEKVPSRRYASYADLIADLDRAMAPRRRATRPLLWIAAGVGVTAVAVFRPERTAPPVVSLGVFATPSKHEPGPAATELLSEPDVALRPFGRWGPGREETFESWLPSHIPTAEELAAIRSIWSSDLQPPPTSYARLFLDAEKERRRTGRPAADPALLTDPAYWSYLPGIVGTICSERRATLAELREACSHVPKNLRFAFEPVDALEAELRAEETLAGFSHELVGEVEFLGWDREGKVRFEGGEILLSDGSWVLRKTSAASSGYRIRFHSEAALGVALSPTRWFDVSRDSITLFRMEEGRPRVERRTKIPPVAEVAVLPHGNGVSVFADGRLVWSLDGVLDSGLKLGAGGGSVALRSIRMKHP